MNLTRSGIRVFLAKVISSGIGFLGIVFFAREIGASQLGIFFLFQALLGMFSIPVDFGIRGAVSKRISEGKNNGEVFSTAIILKALLLSIFISLIIASRDWINSYIGAELAIFLAVVLFIQEFAFLIMEVLKGELRVGETALPEVAQKVVFVGIGSFLLILGFEVVGLVYGLLVGFIAMLVIASLRLSVPLHQPSIETARSLYSFSKYSFVSSVGGYLYNWMDVAMIGLFLSQSDVGVYEVSWRITAVVMLLSQAVATTIFPQVSRWDAEGARDRIEQIIPQALAPILVFVIPSFVGTVVLSREILGIVFGVEYLAGSLVLVILMAEKVVQSVHVILGRSLQGIDRADLAARAGIVAVFFNLVLNVGLIIEYGIVGAAVATGISFIINSIFHGYYLSQFINITLPLKAITYSLIASAIMGVVVLGVKAIFVVNTVPRLFFMVGLGVVVYLLITLIFPSQRQYIFSFISSSR